MVFKKDHKDQFASSSGSRYGNLFPFSRSDVGTSSPSSRIKTGSKRKQVDQSAKNKSVRIAEEYNTYRSNPNPLLTQDIAHQWYTREELTVMRRNRLALIDEIITTDTQTKSRVNFQTVLLQAFRDCCKHHHHHHHHHQQQQQQSDNPVFSPAYFPFLSKMLQLCPCRTGLESLAVPLVAVQQQARRDELQRSIQYLQRQPQHVFGGTTQRQDCLRRSSQAASRPACLYAGLIARAHHNAVTQEG